MDLDKIYKIAYMAALRAAQETGDAFKKLSWFPSNRKVQSEKKDVA